MGQTRMSTCIWQGTGLNKMHGRTAWTCMSLQSAGIPRKLGLQLYGNTRVVRQGGDGYRKERARGGGAKKDRG